MSAYEAQPLKVVPPGEGMEGSLGAIGVVEFSIVTEGEIGFRSGNNEVVLAAGGYITKPRNELHTM